MDVVEIVVVGALGVILIFGMALLGAVIGAFCGWIVGFTPLGVWILNFLSAAHIETNMVDLGAFLGFAGAFFSGSTSSNKN
jgi:hypothetical protein